MTPFLHRQFTLYHRSLACLIALVVVATSAFGATDATIRARLEALVAKAPKGATVGVLVERADTHETIFSHNEATPLIPASNMKAITTAAALSTFGRNSTYRTELRARGDIRDGALYGDLVVVGVGDPSFSGRYGADKSDVVWVFREWAKALRARGVTHVTGDIIGDDDAFDEIGQAPGWPVNQAAEWYCAEVSSLVFNDGCVDVTWKGAANAGQAPTYSLNPPNGHVKLINDVKTTTRVSKGERWYQRTESPNVVKVSGAIRPGRSGVDNVSVEGATGYFVSVLRETLIEEGVTVDGQALDIDELTDKAPFKARLPRLAFHDSPPLADLVHDTNLHSQNLFAELMLKKLGQRAEGVGSFESGGRAVITFLNDHAVDTSGVRIIDGSGLSRDNRLTVQAIVGALRAMDVSTYSRSYRVSLPVGGQTGSLRNRLTASPRDAARVIAKTGYIRGVRALSGWAAQKDGAEYRFSILLNSGEVNVGGGVTWVDSVALALARN